MRKKHFVSVLSAMLMVLLFGVLANATTVSGKLGDNIDWELDEETGTLSPHMVWADEDIELPTGGLIRGEVEYIDKSEEDDSDIVYPEDIISDTVELQGRQYWSKGSGYWDQCSTDYYYSKLPDGYKAWWDAMKIECDKYLYGNADAGNYTKYIAFPGNGYLKPLELVELFVYSNPQYYFLRGGSGVTSRAELAISIYPSFQKGTDRATATAKMKTQFEAWNKAVTAGMNDSQKIKAIHDVICKNVTYDYDSLAESGFSDDGYFCQSAYSTFIRKATVCAGYTKAFTLMCNYNGIQTIGIVGTGNGGDHAWNQICVNDYWYNMDVTWDDQSYGAIYSYYGRNDSGFYGHVADSYIKPYTETCSQSVGSGYIFTVSRSHKLTHTNKEASTCSSSGLEEYYFCDYCRRYYGNSQATVSFQPAYSRLPIGEHNWKEIKLAYTSTCSSQGYRVCECTVCHRTMQEYLPLDPNVHVSTEYRNEVVANCIKKGYSGDEYCRLCNKLIKKGQETGFGKHTLSKINAIEPTCLRGGNIKYYNCRICNGDFEDEACTKKIAKGEWLLPPKGHQWDNGRIIVEDPVTKNGIKSYVCTVCGAGTTKEFTAGKSDIDNMALESFVDRLYTILLNRNAEQSGLDDWVGKLGAGTANASQIVEGIVNSEEFANKNLDNADVIERVYQAMLGRESDSSGKEYWMDKMEKGLSVNSVVNGFSGSSEFAGICNGYNITPGSIQLNEPRDKNEGIAAFVARCYQKALGRNYEKDGINDWCNQILNAPDKKKRAEEVASDGFFHSQEFANKNTSNDVYVEILYRTFLGREYDEAGKADWVGKLNSGVSRDEVLYGFSRSQEFSNIMAGYGL